MDARIALFKPLDVENASDEIKSTIQTINQFIQFINSFRYRDTECNESDIEKRETLVRCLCNKDKQEELRKKVFAYFYCQHMPINLIREKENELMNVFEQFKTYSKFANLTALELAVITIAIQKLLSILQLAQQQTKDVIFQEQIRNTLNDFIAAQHAIYLCMRQHQYVFDKNENRVALPANDILIEILQKIDDLTGIDWLEKWHLTPDATLLLAIPDLPFGDVRDLKTAKHYFDVCHVAHLATKGQWLNRAVNLIDKTAEWTDWCLKGAWWLSRTAVTSSFKMFGDGAKLTTDVAQDLLKQGKKAVTAIPIPNIEINMINKLRESQSVDEEELTPLNSMTHDLHSYVEKMTKLADKGGKLPDKSDEITIYKNKISNQINQLNAEAERWATSCFGFFMQGEINKKRIKVKSLNELLSASDLIALKTLAKKQMESKNKDIIIAGRHSRTNEILQEILGMKYA